MNTFSLFHTYKTTVLILRITDQHFSSSYNHRWNLHVSEVPLPVWRPSVGIADFSVSKQQQKICKTAKLVHWFSVETADKSVRKVLSSTNLY